MENIYSIWSSDPDLGKDESKDHFISIWFCICVIIDNGRGFVMKLTMLMFNGELKRRYLLTLHQKLYLEQNLKQILPFYLSQQSGNEMRIESNDP